ncbi:MAG: metal dependent transcriptional regulator, partial [Candidatus Nanosalina sp. J07AB43]
MDTREDYLSAIYRLTDEGDRKTKTSEVSEKLRVSN